MAKTRYSALLRHTLLIAFGVLMIFPFAWMLATSFKQGAEVFGLSLLPANPTLGNFKRLLEAGEFMYWFSNSLIVGGIVTLSVLFFDSLVGFTLCKYSFPGKNLIFVLMFSIK